MQSTALTTKDTITLTQSAITDQSKLGSEHCCAGKTSHLSQDSQYNPYNGPFTAVRYYVELTLSVLRMAEQYSLF